MMEALNQTNTHDPYINAAKTFNWIEYTTFCSLLGISTLIGIYYGCFKRNQTSKEEYMLGGKTMHVFPIAMSLITSHVSGITLLGVPAEVYEHGTQYCAVIFSTIFIVYITNVFYTPVFYKLQLNSLYEYLEMRFSKTVRAMASLIFALSVVLHTPVVIYIPALAFNQVTGISIHHFAPIICLLCIFYTSIGGLKAVVWSDAIQGVFTLGALVIVVILGLRDVGGLEKVLELNKAGDRLELFNMNPNPLARNTFWTVTIGGLFTVLINIAVHPGSSQRFIALPTFEDAKRSVQIFGLGMVVTKVLAVFIGMIVHAKYFSCDPLMTKTIKNSGQLMPYYVQQIASDYPGLTGIFISGLISAALSTTSANLNTLAGTLYEDFFIKFVSKEFSSTKANLIMKITVIVVGSICVMMVYMVEHLKSVLQMAISLSGITGGPIFAVFALGIFFPWANNKGVIWGTFISTTVMAIIAINAQLAIATNTLIFLRKPLFTVNCTQEIPYSNPTTNLIKITDGVMAHEDLIPVFALSYMYYSATGSLIAVVLGLIVSYCTGSTDLNKLNPDLITPIMRRFLPKVPVKERDDNRGEYEMVMQEFESCALKTHSNNGTI